MSDYPDCYESSNVLCKHTRASITVYVDLDKRLPENFTASSPTAESADSSLTIEDVAMVSSETTIESDSECGGLVLKAGRAVQMTISGGSPDDDEVIVTVGYTVGNGDEDFIDCRLLVGGRAVVESA